ncbi:hypothetical protein RB595_001664 [Gaeumannomyces hyphopodioides]
MGAYDDNPHGDADLVAGLAGSTPPKAAATFCPVMTITEAADGQIQQQRRRTSMFARMPHQYTAPAVDEAETTESVEDQGIDSRRPDDINPQTRRNSEGGQMTRAASGPPAPSSTDAGNGP